jgi:hypothetical protein
MRRRTPDTGPQPPEFPDLGPMPLCVGDGRPCSTCHAVHAFNEAIEEHYLDSTAWEMENPDATPLDIMREHVARRRPVPDAPVCPIDWI